ncbi:MAG: hypothetical protein JWO76_2000 [Nocardioides sp.]|nr:hypothetical protein [Nocardioides sp.]
MSVTVPTDPAPVGVYPELSREVAYPLQPTWKPSKTFPVVAFTRT